MLEVVRAVVGGYFIDATTLQKHELLRCQVEGGGRSRVRKD
jgi:hypothetical protein